jgi:predicted phosphodiesterase
MAGQAIEAAVKANLYQMLGQGASKAAISRQLGIDWATVAKYAAKPDQCQPDSPKAQTVEQTTTPDLAAIVAEFLKQMGGNIAGKPDAVEVVEQPSIQMPSHPQTRCVDLASKRYERTAFISDLHCPFWDKQALTVACRAIRDYKPHLLVIAGDFHDCYSVSEHEKEPEGPRFLQDEFDASKPAAKEVDEAAGDADVILLEGNHEYRLTRLMSKTGLHEMRSMELPIAAEHPKRWLYYRSQTRFKLGPLTMLHGDTRGRGTSVKHAGFGMLSKLRTSCLFGHLHRFQTYHETSDDGTIRGGFANGHLCDVAQAKYITSPDWQSGFSTIDYDWSLGIFSVTPHLIVRGALRWGGVTYAS